MGERKQYSVVDAPTTNLGALRQIIAGSTLEAVLISTIVSGVILLALNLIAHDARGEGLVSPTVFVALWIVLACLPLYPELIVYIVRGVHKVGWELEQRSGVDLNRDGVVGEPPEPLTIETIRPVPVRSSNRIQTVEGLPAGYDKDDFIEFVGGIEARGFTRAAWLQPQYRFESGRLCNRAFHDAAMAVLARMDAIEGRGQGSDGYLKKSAEQVVNELG